MKARNHETIPIYLGETTRIDDDGNVRTCATLDANEVLEQLNSGEAEAGSYERRVMKLKGDSKHGAAVKIAAEADARIAELEIQLKLAQEKIADRDAWIERIPAQAAEEANKKLAELEARRRGEDERRKT